MAPTVVDLTVDDEEHSSRSYVGSPGLFVTPEADIVPSIEKGPLVNTPAPLELSDEDTDFGISSQSPPPPSPKLLLKAYKPLYALKRFAPPTKLLSRKKRCKKEPALAVLFESSDDEGYDEKKRLALKNPYRTLQEAFLGSSEAESQSFTDFGLEPIPSSTSDSGESETSNTAKLHQKPRSGNENNASEIYNTEWVGRIADTIFKRQLTKVNEDGLRKVEADDGHLHAIFSSTSIVKDDSESINPSKEAVFDGAVIWYNQKKNRTGYDSAQINGCGFRVGDFVEVNDEVGELDELSYGRIQYFFEEDDRRMIHLRRFQKGVSTALGETAGPNELFLVTQCDDVELESIARKIQVDFRGRSSSDQTGDGTIEVEYEHNDSYFYRLHYEPKGSSTFPVFSEAMKYDSTFDPASMGQQQCWCCDAREAEKVRKIPKVFGDNEDNSTIKGLSHNGTEYYLNDFVFLSANPRNPFEIGKITKIQKLQTTPKFKHNIQIQVVEYKRYDELLARTYFQEFEDIEPHAIRDERRLYCTGRKLQHLYTKLEGKCQVRHFSQIESLEKYKDSAICSFWVKDQLKGQYPQWKEPTVNDLISLPTWNIKYDGRFESLGEKLEAFKRNGRKLRGMDLFAGLGGFSLGLGSSGSVEPEWAIEIDIAAAKTLRMNKPKVKVYNQDANEMLKSAILQHRDGKGLQIITDLQGRIMPAMPRQGEVEIIFGGCPCQSFTNLNRHKKEDDPRTSLVATFLSYVDFYRSKFVMLENVEGLLDHKIGNIENGITKLILRTLTSLGYQVQYGLLQAAHYATPQNRVRVFFIAALPGFHLPKFPQPSNIPNGINRFSSKMSRTTGAPHRPINIGDAITDLPHFDYINQHQVIPQTAKQKADREYREKAMKISQYETGLKHSLVGRRVQEYLSEPVSEYQRKMRNGGTEVVRDHVTLNFRGPARYVPKKESWKHATTERICNVPITETGSSGHNDLPEVLKPFALNSKKSKSAEHKRVGRYGRRGFQDTLDVCLTDMDPCGPNLRKLHPSQHRLLTVREYARFQGIEDSFQFDLERISPADAYKQIGNAVPVPLGKALGEELLKVLIAMFEKEQETSGTNTSTQAFTGIGEMVKLESEEHKHEGLESVEEEKSVASQLMTKGGSLDDAISLDSDDE